MNTPLGFPFGFYVADNTPLDGKYGIIDAGVWRPYVDTAEALAEVPIGIRHIGLTVNIANVEYWWEIGVTDLDLVTKGGGGGDFWPLSGSAALTGDTEITGGVGPYELSFPALNNFFMYSDSVDGLAEMRMSDGEVTLQSSTNSYDENSYLTTTPNDVTMEASDSPNSMNAQLRVFNGVGAGDPGIFGKSTQEITFISDELASPGNFYSKITLPYPGAFSFETTDVTGSNFTQVNSGSPGGLNFSATTSGSLTAGMGVSVGTLLFNSTDGVDTSQISIQPASIFLGSPGNVSLSADGIFGIEIGGDFGSAGEVLTADGTGGATWQPGGGGSPLTFDNGLTEAAGNVKLGGLMDEASLTLFSFDAAMVQFGQDNIPSIGSLVTDKIYSQFNFSADIDGDFTGPFGNEFSSYMRGKDATHVFDVEFSAFMYSLDDFSIGFLNAARKRLLSDTSIRDESIFNMIPTQLLFQNTSNAGWVGALQLNGTDGSVLSSTDNPISSRVVVKPDELVLRNEEPVSGQFIENTFQFGQTLTEASDDGIAISTMSFSSGGFSLQFPDGNSSFSGQALGINLSDGANGAALEFGADTLLAQFRVYDGADSSGIAFDITEFAINSPEIKLNAVDGILDFIGLTVAAVGADVPTHTAVISLGGVPYKFFVTPV